MVGLSLRRTLIVAGGFWLTFWLVLRVNTEGHWLAHLVVYYAVVTFGLILSVYSVVRWFTQSSSRLLKS